MSQGHSPSLCAPVAPKLSSPKARLPQPKNKLVSEMGLLAIQIPPSTAGEKPGQIPNPLQDTVVLIMALTGAGGSITKISHSR